MLELVLVLLRAGRRMAVLVLLVVVLGVSCGVRRLSCLFLQAGIKQLSEASCWDSKGKEGPSPAGDTLGTRTPFSCCGNPEIGTEKQAIPVPLKGLVVAFVGFCHIRR